ncbi:AAA family ATPase [Archangium violaceum]|nr:AAA family ATPase [Archangium violaceum]WNG34259.1 AAA family ATPase [Archangium violaceum]WNG34282.1 AAA family ATPase [Archangium violaceum]WNG34999.1 AAA family ATPase [Archangium violaceum]WNG35834.1 AAA family ATPase [Archangium violaceum]
MLVEQTLEKLNAMKLYGMANYLRTWVERTPDKELGPTDLVGLLVDAEWVHRENKKLSSRLRNARLRQTACLEDIDYSLARGLTKGQVMELSTSRWVAQAQNVLVTGPTGVGKSFLACALGQKACRDGYGVVYRRTSRLFDELAQARADGTYPHLLRRLAKAQVLILDDFGLEPLGASERKELLEVLEDRYGSGATVVTSQLDPKDWHAVIGDATLADAILDRLVHNAHRLKLTGDSVRRPEGNLTRAKKGAK